MKSIKVLIFFISIMMVVPLLPQEEIREEVKIQWWVLPLFAIDKDGNAVLDLENKDIELRVNKYRIKDFTLYRRSFSVESTAAKSGLKEPLPEFKKNKIVFLLFDMAFTSKTNYEHAKEIAANMVQKAEKNTLFTVIAIDPLSGPKYLGGPLADKPTIEKLINEKVRWDPQTKSVELVLRMGFGTQLTGKGQEQGKGGDSGMGRLSPQEMAYLTEQRSSGFRKANMHYYQAFQTLYQALNSIKDNKFIYLFSEGISLLARIVLAHGKEEYWYFMKQTAGYLSKSGAVLFIINPAGAVLNAGHLSSGEDSLRYLAKQSGGKYIEGEKNVISRKIEKMYRAYYEIAFPDHEAFKGDTRHFTIISKRKGVEIHTLRNLEKSKKYSEMKDMEKEVLVLNLLNPSPLFQSPLTGKPLKIEKVSENKGDILYEINLPRDFSRKSIELFKIWLDENTHEAIVEKESLVTSYQLKINIKKKGEIAPRLVLVNGSESTALVQGILND